MKKNILIVLLVMNVGVQAVSKQQVRGSIKENVSQGVEQFVKNHGINYPVSGTNTAFEFAAQEGQIGIMKALNQKYTIELKDYKKAAILAAQNGHKNIIKYMMEKLPTKADKKAVLKAAVKASIPNISIIKMLIKYSGVKVSIDIVRAAKANSTMSAATLKFITEHYKEKSSKISKKASAKK